MGESTPSAAVDLLRLESTYQQSQLPLFSVCFPKTPPSVVETFHQFQKIFVLLCFGFFLAGFRRRPSQFLPPYSMGFPPKRGPCAFGKPRARRRGGGGVGSSRRTQLGWLVGWLVSLLIGWFVWGVFDIMPGKSTLQFAKSKTGIHEDVDW